MKKLSLIALSVLLLLSVGFKIADKGENYPTVQSAFNGKYYVRSVPAEAFGEKGTTKIFKVKSDADEILDEYPLFMRGELLLGWSPSKGKWCLVHIEPERITSKNDFRKLGKRSRMNFYMGGKKLRSYTGEELEKMGLKRHVVMSHGNSGDFIVKGIEQIPRTNDYVLSIEKVITKNKTEKILLDITTGEPFKTKK